MDQLCIKFGPMLDQFRANVGLSLDYCWTCCGTIYTIYRGSDPQEKGEKRIIDRNLMGSQRGEHNGKLEGVNGGDNGRIERGSQGKIEGRRVKREEIVGNHVGNTLGKRGG